MVVEYSVNCVSVKVSSKFPQLRGPSTVLTRIFVCKYRCVLIAVKFEFLDIFITLIDEKLLNS